MKRKPVLEAVVKTLITVWVVSGGGLSLITSGYISNVPVMKYVFTLMNAFDGWGIETIFLAMGTGCLYYLLRHRQKAPWVSGFSVFLAVCTVVGMSYEQTGNWDCLFLYGIQSVAAVFVIAGYYFAYKHGILLVLYFIEKKREIFYRQPKNRLECFLFEKHTFLGPFLFFFLFGLPWVIAFFPGTLQYDAWFQLRMTIGDYEKIGHHPILTTELMGACLYLGRRLFHSDAVGIFLYTGPQFAVQCLVFSYACHCARKWKIPVCINWAMLLFWGGIFPFFPMWGYTMVKDSLYYIFLVLMTFSLSDLFHDGSRKLFSPSMVLFLVGSMGVTLTRSEGRYVMAVTLFACLFACRKYWKNLLGGIAACCLAVTLEYGYMQYNAIPTVSTGEMLSVPLLQTARYLQDHPDDVTEEEFQILEGMFTVDIGTVTDNYNPIVSDSVKNMFLKHPSKEELAAYFKVWLHQLSRHPDTYVQAFLHHVYGYFYPNVHAFQDYIAHFYLLEGEKCDIGNLDIKFAITSNHMRKFLENALHLWETIPGAGMLLSPGLYVYILLGECVYLVAKKRKEFVLMVPGLCVVLFCILSPVNAYMRYILPLMAIMPLTLACCWTEFWDETAV